MENFDIIETKRLNLIRLMNEDGIIAARLAELIDRDESYISMIMTPMGEKNHIGLGFEIIGIICKKTGWKGEEFYKEIVPEEVKKLSSLSAKTPAPFSSREDLLLRLIDQQSATIKALNDRIDAQGKALQGFQDMVAKMEDKHDSLGLEIGKIRESMGDAARHNDVRLLEAVGGSGK